MSIFKVESRIDDDPDTMYIEAATREAAKKRLFEFTGPIPDRLLTWTDNVTLPEGEELL